MKANKFTLGQRVYFCHAGVVFPLTINKIELIEDDLDDEFIPWVAYSGEYECTGLYDECFRENQLFATRDECIDHEIQELEKQR
jgi:hypothetical protein